MTQGRRIYPVAFRWRQVAVVDPDTGELSSANLWAMVPELKYRGLSERQYSMDDSHVLAPLEARSMKSHSHYFAALHDGFDNLPEGLAVNFPNEEALRAWLLIETGWCDQDLTHLTTEKEARDSAERTKRREPFCRIRVFESVDDEGHPCWAVLVKRAMSQSTRTMGKESFQKSKTDVLEYLDVLIGVQPGTLAKKGLRNG